MTIVGPDTRGGGRISLDGPPPMPERTATRSRSVLDAGAPPSAGPEASDPKVQFLRAASQIEEGFKELVNMAPQGAELAATAISALRSFVANQMAGQGGQPGPGMGAMAPPPPPMMGGMMASGGPAVQG